MSGIRAFERSDAPAVARLYELVARSGTDAVPPGLSAYFERTLLDYPWVDAEIPSLVLEDDRGEIVAFQGSHVRRARFGGAAIRIACAGQLVAHPQARHTAAGARLVQAYLRGPQELTITDGATGLMRELWTMLGGRMSHLACLTWTRVFAPAQFAIWRREEAGASRLSPPRAVARGVDALAGRSSRLLRVPAAPGLLAEPLTPDGLIEHLPLLGAASRLYLDYDRSYLEWLFRELRAVTARGQLVAQLVRDPARSRVLGWYVYYLKPGGTAEVLQIAAAERDAASVLAHLMLDASSGGAAAIRGRVEPRILAALGNRRFRLRFTGDALVHSRSDEILGAIASGSSLLSRLDGEWWMGHHVLQFGRP